MLAQRRRLGPCSPAVSRQQQHAVPRPVCPAARRQHIVCMAAAGSSDPYKVLGVAPDADTNAINRAYSQKKYAARGNDALSQQIEAAHSQIMMSALTRRMKGKGVSKSVAYADTEPLFPWRPKRWDATPKVILIVGALQMAMVAYGFQAPNMSKVIGSMLVGIAGNVLKQNALFPPPKDASTATEEESGRAGRNFVRGALLGVGATFVGVLLFGAPEYLGSALRVKLPSLLQTPGLIVSLKIAGAAISNWIMTSFYY
eukprot:GHRR01007440.1.p1 GENE.GHRR01007440.1~~GHRR01007440.1.p1  ORF type:complete len:257 (+),score=71.45 GHRR01007440.1:107-877(+)